MMIINNNNNILDLSQFLSIITETELSFMGIIKIIIFILLIILNVVLIYVEHLNNKDKNTAENLRHSGLGPISQDLKKLAGGVIAFLGAVSSVITIAGEANKRLELAKFQEQIEELNSKHKEIKVDRE